MNAINTFFNFFERYSLYLKKSNIKFDVSVRDIISGIISVKWDYVTEKGEGFITYTLIFDEDLGKYMLDIEEFFLDKNMNEREYMKTYSLDDDDIDLSEVSMII
jgi:hypothetical protein